MPALLPFFRNISIALFALAASAGVANASPDKMQAALEAVDLPALQAAADSDAERKLAAAVELSWTLRDTEATSALINAAGQQPDLKLRAAALWELMAVQARQGAFMSAVSAGEAAAQLDPPSASLTQALEFFRGLAIVPATRAVTPPNGRIAIKRDLAGLMRADMVIGGVTTGAILDTGANFSTITESLAQKMGLVMLDAAVSVGSSSRDAVASRLGIAQRLKIGDAEFANVVFIVLPDKDLSFANGAYTIDAILGMPVFFQMNRIAVTKADGAEWFSFGDQAPAIPDATRNLVFSGMSPMLSATATVDGASAPLTLMLDSGAQQSNLEQRFATAHPDLLARAETVSSQRGGAGGVVTSDKARRLPTATLTTAGKTISLTNLMVEDITNAERDGLFGLDAMPNGFTIDWAKGVFALN